ncbi:mandelate racemase/muconate lactonizing enzyme family protein [Natrarchaeobius chitinivorans]|uniref:Mandelate racemase/muconate lactonizing enzyme family protein n=1 Tax=Natrarchaeobius chitinivorans TaxID=1679083 RepID=A0A3N6N9X5_NATCH|nr:mandelate racemase/muconate lactonizing enzyme family protein [Natrarchaeobius chitinivorans]RQG95362.1 mandelate racemase/muconate lactonizing enzyme family protein [Natrarchaeobius chitinivorans]
MTDQDDEYVIPPGGGVPWRDLQMTESNRPSERDLEITDVSRLVVQGNFPWSLVKVETDAGITGIGETFVGEESSDVARRVGELIVGENPLDIDRLMDHLEQERTGTGAFGRSAFAGIEIALWDIKGKLLDVPVYELLGGKYRDEVQIYCDTHAGESLAQAQKLDPQDVYTPESYARAARNVVDEGYTALKFDLDVRTHREIDTASRRLDNESIEHKASLIEAVREEIGYEIDLGVDLHWNFTVESAIRLGKKLEPFDLAWIEDPIPPEKTDGHRRIAQALDTPILTGENVTTVAGFQNLLQNDGVDVAAPDVNKTGGLRDLQRVATLCDLYGVPLAPHNISSPVGTVAGVHFAASIPNFLALEFHAADVPWWEDLVQRVDGSGPIIEDGYVDLPEGPGLGIELNDDVVERYLTDEFDGWE